MSKKQKVENNQTEEVVEEQVVEVEETSKKKTEKVVENKNKKDNKNSKDNKKKDKKKEKKGGIGKKVRETASELKKVTWPTFGEVVKKTGIVVSFVVIFGLFLYGINTLLGWLVSLLAGG